MWIFCRKFLVLGSFLGWEWFRCFRFVGLLFFFFGEYFDVVGMVTFGVRDDVYYRVCVGVFIEVLE